MPFSNQRLEGFENKIADVIARDIHAGVVYTWWPQRRGFLRNTLKAHACDVVIGVPRDLEGLATTSAYYRSSYVFVYPTGDLHINSFDDPALRRLRIGVQLVGDDGANSPPAHALANRGLVRNVRGYTVYGDYVEESPPSRIIKALADHEIDAAVVWGPLAGYFARRQNIALDISRVSTQGDPSLPFAYDISLGVRRDDSRLKDELDKSLLRTQRRIDEILNEYDVPRVK